MGKARRIAIGGKKADPVALPKPHAGELCVFQRVALKEVKRRVEPEQLLDRRRSRAFARECEPAGRRPPRASSSPRCRWRSDRRLGDHVQEQDHRDPFVLAQSSAVAFGDEELADEIVADIAAPRTRKAADEIGERPRRLGRAFLDLAETAPNWYIATIRCNRIDELVSIWRGTPSRSAITATGMGAANSAMRSAEPSCAKPSIRSCTSAAIRGPSFSIRRETKARLTRLRSLVCSGGSSFEEYEWRSSASNG